MLLGKLTDRLPSRLRGLGEATGLFNGPLNPLISHVSYLWDALASLHATHTFTTGLGLRLWVLWCRHPPTGYL